MRIFTTIIAFTLLTALSGCSGSSSSSSSSGSGYSFTGSNISKDVKTFQVIPFQNKADIVEPGIERTLTIKLQDLIKDQTQISLTNNEGDIVYEGEITQYRISPMQATANQLAAQNRLTITVNLRFTNRTKKTDNFEKPFSFYFDYSGNELPTGATLTAALEEIFERITQDIFNASLAKW